MNRILPLLLILLLIGCSGLKRKYPERNYFTFDVVEEITVKEGDGENYLKIERADVNPAYMHRDFNYRIGTDEFISDYYNQFYRPVGALLSSEIYKWLSNSALFRDVLPVNTLLDAKYLLDSKLIDIYGDYRNPEDPRAVLNMQFFLIDDSTDTPKITYTNVYNQSVPISGRTPVALVEGWNRALKNILTDFEKDLGTIPNL